MCVCVSVFFEVCAFATSFPTVIVPKATPKLLQFVKNQRIDSVHCLNSNQYFKSWEFGCSSFFGLVLLLLLQIVLNH